MPRNMPAKKNGRDTNGALDMTHKPMIDKTELASPKLKEDIHISMNLDHACERVKPYMVTASGGGDTFFLGLYRTLARARRGAHKHPFTQQIEEILGKDVALSFVKDGTSQNKNWYEAVVRTKGGKITYVISREQIR
jgi:hypothetical protein